jgi:subtilisin family serine protease
MKPDLVAPGEKIDAPICAQQFATLEGTSMAAPHVSGAAALLMARFPELIGNAKRIKQILCDSATDLGRERAYQGCGLVDVLRALQSV